MKLRALALPKTCFLREIARTMAVRTLFPARGDTTLRTPKFNTGKVVEHRTRDVRRKHAFLCSPRFSIARHSFIIIIILWNIA